MEKEVLIKVKSSSYTKETGADFSGFECEGRLDTKDGKMFFRYTEPDSESGKGARVILKADGGVISVNRSGETSSKLFFEKGKIYNGYYLTPFGTFAVSVKTHFVRIKTEETEGKIDIGYTLVLNETQELENNFCIEYKFK